MAILTAPGLMSDYKMESGETKRFATGMFEWIITQNSSSILSVNQEFTHPSLFPSCPLEHTAANIPSSRTRASERELSSLAMFPSEEKKI